MTDRANQIIDILLENPEKIEGLMPIDVAALLCHRGFLPSESGWVLRHVFGKGMPEAVHISMEAREHVDSVAERARPSLSRPEALRDDDGNVHRIAA